MPARISGLVLAIAALALLGVYVSCQQSLGRADYTDFSIVVLPDTQIYCSDYPDVFSNQTQWIVDNSASRNIVFVTHEGDIVDTDIDSQQWQRANASMSKLDGHVPWGVCPGNHDGDWMDPLMYGWAMFNKCFGYARFNGQSWYGGAYKNNYTGKFENANNYELFSGGGGDYIIFHFQYDPSDDVLAWANATIRDYPGRRAIVTTHYYLGVNGNRSAIGNRIWERFIKYHTPQVFLVLCGHLSREARSTDISTGFNVYQIMANYQGDVNGGNGLLRLLEFRPTENKIFVRTFSPYTNSYETDLDSEFTVDYVMTDEIPEFPQMFIMAMLLASTAATAIRCIRKYKHNASHERKDSCEKSPI